jgi:hypothetical protein
MWRKHYTNMSRTTRLKKLVKQQVVDPFGYLPTRFRRSGYRDAKQRAAEEAHGGYVPRSRHSCLHFPHYTSSWDDIIPSVGLWEKPTAIKFKIKPKYTNKKKKKVK